MQSDLNVSVQISGWGNSNDDVVFHVVDFWSDPWVWAGRVTGPLEGDVVVVPRGRHMVLDIQPPRLGLVLVRGVLEVAGLHLLGSFSSE